MRHGRPAPTFAGMTRIRFVRSEAVQPPSQPGASGLPRVLYVGQPSSPPYVSVREPPSTARSLDGLVLSPVADRAPGRVGTRTRGAAGPVWWKGSVRAVPSGSGPVARSRSGRAVWSRSLSLPPD